jgi:hypothetical protein
MNYCSKNNIKGVMLSVDMAKAFDSVAHCYLEDVYEFFGFGDRIIRWLKSIGTNRKAFVILEDGNLSKGFDLKRGTAQGDSPSPFLYNLAAQILLWKIELDPDIEGIYPPVPENDVVPDINHEFFAYESNRETNRNESFADDGNNFVLLKFESLLKIKNILLEFRYLSGLSCNVEKSFVMRIGDLSGEVEQRILDLGFPFTNSLTVLGFHIANNGTIVSANFEKVRVKINNIIRFWERFGLSLSGKIAIYKTLILPQINFVGTVLTPPEDTIKELSQIIEKFISKGLNISKKRLYLNPTLGGVGVFNLTNFIMSLQVSWIKRASVFKNDNWKVDLANLGNGNVLNCDTGNENSLGIGLTNIVRSFRNFKNAYFRYKGNFLEDTLYNNNRYGAGRNRMVPFDDVFFGEQLMTAHGRRIRELRWKNLCINGTFIEYN